MPLAGKPISAYRSPRPLPPRWERQSRLHAPNLAQFVLLSMLLHALAITLFGAPSGGSREGRALWGSLQVVLQGAAPEPAPELKLERSVRLKRPRVERSAPQKPSAPVQAPPKEAPFSMPPVLSRIPTPQLKLERMRPLQVPPPTPIQTPPAPIAPATTPAPPPAEASAPAEKPEPVRVERVQTEAPFVPAPLLQPVPTPMPERMAAPPIIERPQYETPIVPATPPPTVSAPVEVPAIPVPPLETISPIRSEPSTTPVEKAPVQEAPKLPPAVERVETPAPERAPPVKAAPVPPPAEVPALLRSPIPTPPTDVFKRREPEPSRDYDPTAAPTVDLDAARKRAAQMAREGTGQRSLLPFPMPPLPERKTKEQIAIEKALKPDCRTAYKDLGLAAVVPLIANEFGEGSCRW